MIRRIQFNIVQRPAWQRFLIFAGSIALVAVLFWIGLILVFGLAFVALIVAAVNFIKLKITGRPLFKGPQHFHRYQSQFNQHNEQKQENPSGKVIEGEVVDRKNDE